MVAAAFWLAFVTLAAWGCALRRAALRQSAHADRMAHALAALRRARVRP